MVENKEKNFISAVVYLHNDGENVVTFMKKVQEVLEKRFEQYEIVAVDDRCTDNTVAVVREWAKELTKPLTIIHMSLYQGLEIAMNAGLDCAIGDYVYEFDRAFCDWDAELINMAYDTAVTGSDIVSVCPDKQRVTSRMFYGVFNRYSRSAYKLRTDTFRLVSRRAINRVHAVSSRLPYRKAAYAASGLKMSEVTYFGSASSIRESRFSLAVDSLVLYTDAGYRFSLGLTAAMLICSLAELIYTVLVYLNGTPIEGWTTTMFVLTLGLLGLFLLLSFVFKYLSLILEYVFRNQTNLVESIEKIQK